MKPNEQVEICILGYLPTKRTQWMQGANGVSGREFCLWSRITIPDFGSWSHYCSDYQCFWDVLTY